MRRLAPTMLAASLAVLALAPVAPAAAGRGPAPAPAPAPALVTMIQAVPGATVSIEVDGRVWAPGAGERITAFVSASAIPVAMLGVLQALPNTALWQRLEREGRLLSADQGRSDQGLREQEFSDGVQTHLLNFVPSRPMADIAGEFLEAFDRLYEPAAYLQRVADTCRRLPPERHRSRGQIGRAHV